MFLNKYQTKDSAKVCQSQVFARFFLPLTAEIKHFQEQFLSYGGGAGRAVRAGQKDGDGLFISEQCGFKAVIPSAIQNDGAIELSRLILYGTEFSDREPAQHIPQI